MTGIIDNQNVKLEDIIEESLQDENVDKLRIGVGYFFTSGLKSILPELKEFIDRGGQVDILVGNSVNRQTFEELTKAYKSLEIAESKQSNHLITGEEKKELKRGFREDIQKQVLFQEPVTENEKYFQLLQRWLDNKDLKLKIYPRERFHAKTYLFETKESGLTRPHISGVVGSSNLTLSGLRSNTELNAAVYSHDAEALEEWYQNRWDEADDFSPELLKVINNSWVSHQPGSFPSPYLVYLKTIYEMYKESLETVEEALRTYEVYQDLYEFQKWAVLRAVRVAENYGGVMVSDVVGMGKSYVGAALLEHFYHKERALGKRGKLLIICPPKLESMWERIVGKYSLHADIESQGMLSKEGYYEELQEKHEDALVTLIDESHHFRNSNTNRYESATKFLPLTNKIVLLTATPYTKGAEDVYNQIKLFHPEDITKFPITPPDLKEFIKQVEDGESSLSELLAHAMVRRTRHEILKQYGEEDEEGRYYLEMEGEKKYLPERHLKTEDYSIENVYGKGFYQEIVESLTDLNYTRYSLGSEEYLKPEYSDQRKYRDLSTMGKHLRGLMKKLLLKRLESSIPAFSSTLKGILNSYSNLTQLLREGEVAVGEEIDELLKEDEELEDIRDELQAKRERGEIPEYDIDAFYADNLESDLERDIEILEPLVENIEEAEDEITEDYTKDDKLSNLAGLVDEIYGGTQGLIEGKSDKILIFSQYQDTVKHLKEGLEKFQELGLLKKDIRISTATGDTENVNERVERFAPKANEVREKIQPEQEIDVLISTDLVGEGLNLQDANVVINYDIHWNPLKLIQRIGRVDRLGAEHENAYVFNFLPETSLEKELELVDTVGSRIEEINDVLGMDDKVLREEEKPNPSFMKAVYGEDMKAVEEYERDVMLGEDAISGSVNELRRLKEKNPELLSEISEMDGIRSAKKWDGINDAVFLLCAAGDHKTPYLVEFDEDGGEVVSESPEEIIQRIKSEEGEGPCDVSSDVFRERYSEACKLAREKFENEVKKKERLTKPRSSKYRDYVVDELTNFAESVDDSEQEKTIYSHLKVVRDTNLPQVLSEFEDLEKNNIDGEKILAAVKEIIGKYKLEEKFERRKDLREALAEPSHVVCGMYLKSSEH